MGKNNLQRKRKRGANGIRKGDGGGQQTRRKPFVTARQKEAAAVDLVARARIKAELNGLELGGDTPGKVRFLTNEAQLLVSKACALLCANLVQAAADAKANSKERGNERARESHKSIYKGPQKGRSRVLATTSQITAADLRDAAKKVATFDFLVDIFDSRASVEAVELAEVAAKEKRKAARATKGREKGKKKSKSSVRLKGKGATKGKAESESKLSPEEEPVASPRLAAPATAQAPGDASEREEVCSDEEFSAADLELEPISAGEVNSISGPGQDFSTTGGLIASLGIGIGSATGSNDDFTGW